MAKASRGNSFPIGATVTADGVNFCIYSKHATSMELLLFDRADDAKPAQVFQLDPVQNRSYHYWHIFLSGVKSGEIYGYRAYGPNDPATGQRFDPTKLLLDPYTRAVVNVENYDPAKAALPFDNAASAMKGVVVDPTAYDWEGDTPIERPFAASVIYEMHVAGFTCSPNSGIAGAKRGAYAGLIEKIPYLQDLGVLAVELMPVQQFDALAAPNRTNYWGYQPVAWFAPHRAFSSQTGPLGPVNEFRDMVKAFHRAGIEVILDVVFNHTAEGGADGPTISLRGLDNPTYYISQPGHPGEYVDDTGCGNTVNGNETVVRRMIVDCLRYWVQHMHVDGFRFDLASSLSRGEDGAPLEKPPLLLDIESDPVLARATIIAEPWDVGGLYQVTNFAGDRWAVWNGKFRDNIRKFVKSDVGMVSALADSLLGSAKLFQQPNRDPCRSVNFVTAHDGFTLNDLVSYDDKHNLANGEENRDGSDDNESWNCGVEGDTADPDVESLRRRQIKNFLTLLLLSQGRPMLLMGDEVRRTQLGNNNAYCQDNELSWFNWGDVEKHADIRRFTRGLIRLHQQSVLFRDRKSWEELGGANIDWHGVKLNQPDWGENSHALAFELSHPEFPGRIYGIHNAFWGPLTFELPLLQDGHCWRRLVDTSMPTPDDFSEPPIPLPSDQRQYSSGPRSSVILVSGLAPTAEQGMTQRKPNVQ